jgi:GTP pyrophosphokinase
MVEILAEFQLDSAALQAALLYRAVREGRLAVAEVEAEFGSEVVTLIEQVQRMAVITTQRNDSDAGVFGGRADHQAVKIRQMLVALIEDVRVPLIKLAERACAIRAVKGAEPEKQQRVAREIFDIYAPLADRLGIGHLKWELEDLAFRYLEPDDYQMIAKLLAEKRSQRQSYIDEVVATLGEQLDGAAIAGEVTGRVKHIYSIWRKMQRKEVGFSQVYDIRAVRVLVPTIDDCYTLLGWVQANWRGIPREFDDYIANPKENGYRSLHSAVVGPDNKVVEIQIRTFAMHREAELGICAHWRYKSGDGAPSARDYERKIEWLRQVLGWQQQLESEVVGLAAHGVNEQRIYVFTPDGHVVDLPVGSTPLDFAYHIHTDIGHRCRAARVNGKRVALNRPLQTADRVEIFTVKQGAPSRRWLRTARGYLASSRAREKIRQWFSRQRDSDLASGERHWLLTLEVSDRRGLLLDVTRALSSFGVNIAALHTSDLDASQKSMQLELTHLFEGDQAALIAVLEQLPAVGSASLVPQPLAVDSESQP